VFVAPGTSVQILCAIFVCVIFLGLVSFYKPYEADDDDTFSFISFICLVFTLVLGLGMVRDSSRWARCLPGRHKRHGLLTYHLSPRCLPFFFLYCFLFFLPFAESSKA
jgi:hypothetical protein